MRFGFMLLGIVVLCVLAAFVYSALSIGTVGQIAISGTIGLVWGWNSDTLYNRLFHRS